MSVQPVTYPPHPGGEGGSATTSSRVAFPILSKRGTSRQAYRRDSAMIRILGSFGGFALSVYSGLR
eukprot:3704616-Pleurochrysis_carterae.AAC.1